MAKLATRMLTLVTTCFLSINAYSDQVIYQWTSEDGQMHFSDQPNEKAKKLIIQEVKTIPAVPIQKLPEKPEIKKEVTIYSDFTITSPENNSTHRNGTGNVLVELSIEPKLAEKDLIQFYLDGKKVGKPQKKNSMEFLNIDRGQHSISAEIIDSSEIILMTTPQITIFMHRNFGARKIIDNGIKIVNKTSLFPKTQAVK